MAWVARVLLWVESVVWSLLGALLIVGGLVVLGGGTGVPGVVNVDEPGFGRGIGAWAAGLGVAVLAMGVWGLWIGTSLRRHQRSGRIGALAFCALWIAFGVVWITVATTPIPGAVTTIVNGVILVGFVTARGAQSGSGLRR
jgi:hypothetical protein